MLRNPANGEPGVFEYDLSFGLQDLRGFKILRDILVFSLIKEAFEEAFEGRLIFRGAGFGFPSIFYGVDTFVGISKFFLILTVFEARILRGGSRLSQNHRRERRYDDNDRCFHN